MTKMNKNVASTKPMEKGTNPNPRNVKTNPRHNIPIADEAGNVSNGDLYGTTCRSSSSSAPACQHQHLCASTIKIVQQSERLFKIPERMRCCLPKCRKTCSREVWHTPNSLIPMSRESLPTVSKMKLTDAKKEDQTNIPTPTKKDFFGMKELTHTPNVSWKF